MLRIRFSLPRQHWVQYRFLDLVHDALINAWTKAGASPQALIGSQAAPWTFAALGYHRQQHNLLHTLVVATPDAGLAASLFRLDPAHIQKTRPETEEALDLSKAEKHFEPDPILPDQGQISALMLSPLVIRSTEAKKWLTSLQQTNPSAAVNARLSRLAGRDVNLHITPDSLYLRANPQHSVLIPTKGFPGNRISFVIGVSSPLVLQGSDADLRVAWYSGIGEKNRNGFGCLGLLDQGVGR